MPCAIPRRVLYLQPEIPEKGKTMDLIRPKKDYCDKNGSKDAIRIADGIAVAVVEHLKEPDSMFTRDGFKELYLDHVRTLHDHKLDYEAIEFIAYVFYEKELNDAGQMVAVMSAASDSVKRVFVSKFIKYASIKSGHEMLNDILDDMAKNGPICLG